MLTNHNIWFETNIIDIFCMLLFISAVSTVTIGYSQLYLAAASLYTFLTIRQPAKVCKIKFDYDREGFSSISITLMVIAMIFFFQSHVGMIALLDEECLRPGEVRKLASQVKFIVY